MSANIDVPINWWMYSMIVSRLQVNNTVIEAFHWTARNLDFQITIDLRTINRKNKQWNNSTTLLLKYDVKLNYNYNITMTPYPNYKNNSTSHNCDIICLYSLTSTYFLKMLFPKIRILKNFNTRVSY